MAPAMMVLNGKSAGDEALRAAVTAAREAGRRLEVRVTWEAGDAARFVKEAQVLGLRQIVAAGGDGTLSEVAEALAHAGMACEALPTLALVPLGTANDFATAAGIPVEPAAALALLDGAARPVDLLRIRHPGGEHWCANLASGGFGTEVTVETHETLKNMLGGLAYVITGLGKLGRIEPQQAHFIGAGADGTHFEWRGDFIAIGIGNGRQAGGGQALCPDALIDDGLLDLTVIPPLDGEIVSTLGTVLTEGKEAALNRVALRARLAWLEIEPTQPLTLNLDGEPVTAARFRIDCVPGCLRLHLPTDTPLRAAAAPRAAAIG